jgi:hypothetical protein
MKQPVRSSCLALALALLVFSPRTGAAQEGMKPLLPDEKAFGLTLGEWSAAYWQWVLSIPLSSNPKEGRTGLFSQVGQHGPVWFLPDSPEPGGVTVRSIAIPAGRSILFPVTGAISANPVLTTSEEFIRKSAREWEGMVTVREASVNGVALTDLPKYKASSPLFHVQLPPGNAIGFPVGAARTSPVPMRAAAEGHWILLPPLPVGQHVIKVRREYSDGWKADLTYNITVQEP